MRLGVLAAECVETSAFSAAAGGSGGVVQPLQPAGAAE